MESDFHVGEWFVRPQLGTVTRGDRSISLEPRVMDVLVFLVTHEGQLLPKDQIIREVWKDTFVGDGVLVHAISELRKAFGDDPHDPSIIETLPKRGYRLIAPVTWAVPAAPEGEVVRSAARRNLYVTLPVATVILLGAVSWLLFDAEKPAVKSGEITSLAVLPLMDLSEGTTQEYFTAGMTDALISELGKISSLRVISRQSVLRFKETDLSLPEIADELNVGAIVEGSVVRDGTRIRISAQLIGIDPERHLWADSYERDLSDVLFLQSELAQAVARQIRAAVTPEEQERLARTQEVHPDAYEAYLKGRFHWDKWTSDGVRKSKECFLQAIAIDPDYAPAWAGLSFSYRFPSMLGRKPGKEVLPEAKIAAVRAVELDSTWAEGQATLGVNECYEWNWSICEERILQALALNPSYAHGHHMYSNLNLAPQGRLDEALREILHARELAPLSLPHNAVLGKIYYLRREYDQAISQLRQTVNLDPGFAMTYSFLGNACRENGDLEDAVDAHRRAVSLFRGDRALGELGYTCAVSGRRSEALDLLEMMLERSKAAYASAQAVALIYTGLGEQTLALEWLEKAYRDQDLGLAWIKVDPVYDSLREHPGFKDLLQRANLVP